MDEKERIRAIRKENNLTLEEFGSRIGITKATASRLETGGTVTDRTRLAICREFGVSEDWLRTGAGEMFEASGRYTEIDAFFAGLKQDAPESFRLRLVSALSRLPEKDWIRFEQFVRSLVEETEQEPEDFEAEARREAEEYYQQRLAEKRAQRTSSVSGRSASGAAGNLAFGTDGGAESA